MTIDTTELRRLAQKATPGPWWADGDNVKCRIRCYGSDEPTQITIWRPPAVGFAISDEQNEATALFIAQLNPENILALLDELEKRTLRADILEEMLTRAQHHVIFSRELDKGMLKRLLTAGSDKWVYSLRNELSDAGMEIDRLTDENVKLRTIESAARNYVQRNGRNNIDPDYQKLVEVLG